jgi:superfamily I DNA/RNA helicase
MTTNTRTAAADKGVKPERLADLANFYLGFDAFLSWLEDTDGQIDAFVKRGEMFARRYMPELEEAIQQHLAPLIERNDAARLKPAFRRSERSGSPTDKARFKAEFLQELFFWLRAHQEVFRNTFSGKSRKSATLLMRLAAEDAPVSLVAQAAASPSVSGLQAPRKWLLAAAERMGAAVSEAEMALSNVESLANLATEVKKVEGQLEGVDPNSEDAAELLAQKAALLAQMDENSEGDKGALQAAAAAAYKPSIGHQTQMGAKLSLNAQQEAAMMASGKKVVAAGAGSGKTRVLAGEVAYRINEQGYDASSICAVSFTRKSSKELIKRVSDYGAIIDGPAASGFGTTHFLAGVTILGGYGKSTKRPKYFGKKQNWAVTTLVALAVKQVSMKGGQGMQAPEPKNLFNGKPISVSQDVLDTPVPDLTTPEMDSKTAELISIIEDGIEFFQYGWPSRWKGGDWGRTSARFLTDMKNRLESGVTPDQWSPRQREYLNKLMGNIQKEFGRSMRVGAIEEEPSVDVPDSDESKAQRKGISKYQYWDQPARQWFNLGLKWEGGGKDGKEGQQFSAAGVKRKIDIWKGMGASPEEVWYAAGAAEGKVEPYSPEAAAYAAYEWLKGSNGEPDFRNTGDMNDLLIDATKTLVLDKKARAALQSRFKVILVDEAQDLNRTQHLLFGMLAGAIDPETMKSKADGSMTADTFSFVGDDKQAIYEFRGAEPDEFIDKSDLGPSAGDFQTLLLDTNYRSGQAIVEAANQLIKHNEKQIPMTCKANVEAKGDGHITAKSFGDPAEAGNYVADYISDNADAHSTGKVKYGNFGVAVRSNAEAMHYALGMVKRAIPFKSSANPFKSPPIKSMLGWMSMVEGGPSMDRDSFLKAAADSLRMPTSYLGKAFGEKLESQRDPLGWLKSMDPYEEFRSNYAKNVEAWLENVAICFRLHGTEDTPDVVYSHLLANLKSSDGQSFFDGIIENIKGNNDKMAELAAENPDGIPTDEQINEAAEEELVLLDGLMGSKDTVDGVMGYVRELKAVNDRVAAGEDDDKDAVIIGTMHSWKGLEVPKLFMPLVRGKFPRAKLAKNPISGELECMTPDKDDPALHSERRLAYVAITRAEDSCVMMDIANPSKAFEGCPPSQFISESCVQWASEQEAVEPEGKMAADELTYLWNDEYEMEPWMLEGPTDEEADEAKLVFDMESTPIEDTPADDPMLAEWFKTTGEG